LIDEELKLRFDFLATAQKIRQRCPTDNIAQPCLCCPADSSVIVLHLERCFLAIVNHPEKHRVDIDRNRVRREGLLCSKASGDDTLVDPRANLVNERRYPEDPWASQPDVAPEPQHNS